MKFCVRESEKEESQTDNYFGSNSVQKKAFMEFIELSWNRVYRTRDVKSHAYTIKCYLCLFVGQL